MKPRFVDQPSQRYWERQGLSYEDLVRARVDRARKERAKEIKRASKEGKRKRGARDVKEPVHHMKPLEALSGENGRVRKRRGTAPATHARATQAADNEQETSAVWPAAYTCTGQVGWHNVVPMPSSQRAPMATM
jgi:hypothetical protein